MAAELAKENEEAAKAAQAALAATKDALTACGSN